MKAKTESSNSRHRTADDYVRASARARKAQHEAEQLLVKLAEALIKQGEHARDALAQLGFSYRFEPVGKKPKTGRQLDYESE